MSRSMAFVRLVDEYGVCPPAGVDAVVGRPSGIPIMARGAAGELMRGGSWLGDLANQLVWYRIAACDPPSK